MGGDCMDMALYTHMTDIDIQAITSIYAYQSLRRGHSAMLSDVR